MYENNSTEGEEDVVLHWSFVAIFYQNLVSIT